MKWHYEQRVKHREWIRRKKRKCKEIALWQPESETILHPTTSMGTHMSNYWGQDIPPGQSNGNMPHPSISNSRPVTNRWVHQYPCNGQEIASRQAVDPTIPKQNTVPSHCVPQYPFVETADLSSPQYSGPLNNYASYPPPMESPKTPPSSSTASHRRRCAGLEEPLSPPNPLRLASTTAPQQLPRPDVHYLRSTMALLNLKSFCESVGDPCYRVFRVRLPDYLIDGPLDTLVEASERYVSRLPNGWRTNLYTLTKCDIPCEDIPGISTYVKQIVTFVSCTMKMLYGCQDITLDRNQPHILKYSAETGHTGVGLHSDLCDITANLSLSKSNTYLGGGTYISAMHQNVRLEQGEILLHPGHLLHCGCPIVAGKRYLLVTFANIGR